MEDWQRRDYDPPGGEPDRGAWLVHVALEPAERDVIQQAAPAVLPAEQFEIHTEITENGDGDVLLALRVYATTSNDATERASETYRRIRLMAGLPSGRALVLGYISPWWHQHRTADLSREALELNKQGRHELAVIRVQTACELAIASALARLLRHQHPEVSPAPLIGRPTTLRDDRSKAFLQMLTGRRVQDEGWWPSYIEHLKRRNAIVHEGLVIDSVDAVASINASLLLRKWLLEVQGAPEEFDDE